MSSTATEPDPALRLRVRGLTLRLPNGRALLDALDLDVRAGEIVVILGRSGAGKSTLGGVLFDLLPDRIPGVRIEAGALEVDTRAMSLVLQGASLFDHMSVRENLRFAARRRRGRHLSDTEVDALLAEVGMDADEDAQVNDLSGGQRQRINVARGLASQPTFFYFDEPTTGLDVTNVYRMGALIRRVCDDHAAGAVVVTHDPLLAALVGDRLLYLDRNTKVVSDLVDDWSGPCAADDEAALAAGRRAIEAALLAAPDVESPARHQRERLGEWVGRHARALPRTLLAPGRVALDGVNVALRLPRSLRHPRDFLSLWWYALKLTGYTGLPFYALVAAIFSTTLLSIAFAAAALIGPQVVLENLRGDFILAMTPALCGFLFAARSGSALAAWLGGMSLRGQTDALRSLGVDVDAYLRVPAFLGTFAAFVLSAVTFGAAMYGAGVVTAAGFGIPDAAAILRETSPDFRRQLIEKTVLYAALVGILATHVGLLPKRVPQDVARGITRTIIFCTLAVVMSELFFAFDLHAY